MRVAVVQLCSTDDVGRNLERARAGIEEAAARGAEFVALPEAFAFLRREGAAIPDPVALEQRVRAALSEWARTSQVWLLGGSLPESTPGSDRLFNTSPLLDPDGRVVAEPADLP